MRATVAGEARRACLLLAALLLASLPAGFAPDVAAAMGELRMRIDTSNPYFSSSDMTLLYLYLPTTVMACMVLLLAPGLLIAAVLNSIETVEEWVLKGFIWSLLVVTAAATIAQELIARTLTGWGFVATVCGCTLLGGAALVVRTARTGRRFMPTRSGNTRKWLLIMWGPPTLFLIALTPKFFWESFNGDGAHAYESCRLLLHQSVPFWPEGSGAVSSFPGMNTFLFAYPSSWFLRLFGPCEAAVRLPFLLEFLVLYAAIVSMARVRGSNRTQMDTSSRILIWLGLMNFGLVMCFSATYDPYCADIALPATQDALLMLLFIGALHALSSDSPVWIAVFVFLTATTSPNGLLLVALLLLSTLLMSGATSRGRAILAISIGGSIGLMLATPALLATLGGPTPGAEHGAANLLRRLMFVRFDGFEKIAYAGLAGGFYPLLALIHWRSLAPMAKSLWLVSGFVFCTFYFMAFVSLHYFVPAMILPLVAFWHGRAGMGATWRARAVWAALAVLCLIGALPKTSAIYTGTRDVGSQIDWHDRGSYESMAVGFARPLRLLLGVIPSDAKDTVPDREYGGSPLAWGYYAKMTRPRPPNFTYRLRTLEPPPSLRVDSRSEQTPYDLQVIDAVRAQANRVAKPTGSLPPTMYTIPRDLLFPRPWSFERYGIVDIRSLFKSLTRRR